MNYEHPSEFNINKNIQNDLRKCAKQLVSLLENNTDINSWENLSHVAITISKKATESLEQAGFLTYQVLNQLEEKIQSHTLNSPVAEFDEVQSNGKISKEAKDLLLKTIMQEQQERVPMALDQALNFTKMLIEVSEQYDTNKVLTFEWHNPDL